MRSVCGPAVFTSGAPLHVPNRRGCGAVRMCVLWLESHWRAVDGHAAVTICRARFEPVPISTCRIRGVYL